MSCSIRGRSRQSLARAEPAKTAFAPLSSPSGFTLIEVLVVVLLIGIATSIVLPRIRDSSSGQRALQRSVTQLAGAAILASEQAAYRRTVYLLRLDLVQGTFSIAPLRGIVDTTSTETSLATGKLSQGITFASVDRHFASAPRRSREIVELRFAPDGWAEAATIELLAPTGAHASVEIHEVGGIVETTVYDAQGKHS